MFPAVSGAPRGLNSKLNVVCDGEGKPLIMLLSEGQMNDHAGAKLLYTSLPPADILIADKGYDGDEFRQALAARKIKACIPPKSNRTIQHFFRPATLQDLPKSCAK
jgi:transposase